MSRGGKIIVTVFVVAVTALIAGAVISFSQYLNESNKEDMNEFVTNAQALGFIIDPEVRDENSKKLANPRSAHGEISLNVLVNGCSVELVRGVGARESEDASGNKGKPFETRRVFLTQGGQHTTKAYPLQTSPTVNQIKMTLADNGFSCYTP